MFPRTSTFSLIMLLLSTSTSALQTKARDFNERELIVGGTKVTDTSKYPYMTGLQSAYVTFCGATLVAPNVLLTAAHCMDDMTDETFAKIGSEKFNLQSKVVHPNFKLKAHMVGGKNGPIPEYDYMLLVLYRDSAAPIVVLEDGIDWNDKATIIGKGVHSSDGNSVFSLHEAEIDIISKADDIKSTCSSYRGAFHTNHMICAASPGKDSCSGDSGGPLLQNGKQIGVVSYEFGCAKFEYPGVYARVSYAHSWITSELKAIKDAGKSLGGEYMSQAPCMAGSTRVVTPEGLVRVDELEVGMQAMGITAEDVQDPNCNVVAIGSNGVGSVYGNYTSQHFVRQDNRTVSEHGENGERRTDSLFDVLLDCPFGVDEVGSQFSAMANYHAVEEDRPSVSIDQYLIVYKVLLMLVKKTGTFWMYSESYKNITDARIKESEIIDLMMECLDSNFDQKACVRLEEAAKIFVEEQFPSSKRRALVGVSNITIMEEAGGSYGDIIKGAFPMLGSPTGGNGTVVYALRQEVQKSGTPGLYAVLSTLIVVASLSVTAMIMIVWRRRRSGKSKELAPESIVQV